MKHAGAPTLLLLAPLLERLRSVPGLVERRPGTFYFRSASFLHFHDDPAGVFADVKLDGASFERLPVHTTAHQMALFVAVSEAAAQPHCSARSAGA